MGSLALSGTISSELDANGQACKVFLSYDQDGDRGSFVATLDPDQRAAATVFIKAHPTATSRIRQFRLKRGYTQRQLAELLEVTQATLCRWENGASRPLMHNVLALCDILKVSIADLDATYYGRVPVVRPKLMAGPVVVAS